jgi:hypothetical protein
MNRIGFDEVECKKLSFCGSLWIQTKFYNIFLVVVLVVNLLFTQIDAFWHAIYIYTFTIQSSTKFKS